MGTAMQIHGSNPTPSASLQEIDLAPIWLLAETQIGPVFSVLFVPVMMSRVEQRRLSPRMRAANR
jgi:hypothetical protein